MAKGFDISIVGDKKLIRKFKTLEAKTQKKFVRKALRAAGKPVLAAAKQKVPVREGKLKKSLKLRAIKRSRTGVGVLIKTGNREELGIKPGEKGFYPFSVEYGTANTPEQSYLRAGMDENRDKALKILGDELWRQIKAEGAKGVKR